MTGGPPTGSGPETRTAGRSLSRRTVGRLPVYLRALAALADEGVTRVSSVVLAERTGVGSPLVRRDLAGVGHLGRPGVGYPVAALQRAISQVLGLAEDQPVVLVGAGHLGSALAGYDGFAERGLRICAVLDADPRVIGQARGASVVRSMEDLEEVVSDTRARLAILAVPADAAQPLADRLAAAGIQGLLNFAPVELTVPQGVSVRAVDLSTELQILAFHQAALHVD